MAVFSKIKGIRLTGDLDRQTVHTAMWMKYFENSHCVILFYKILQLNYLNRKESNIFCILVLQVNARPWICKNPHSFAICCKNNHFPVDVFSTSFHFLHIVMWTCWIFYNTTLHSTQNTPRASKINIQFSCCAAFKRLLKVHFKFSIFPCLWHWTFQATKQKRSKRKKVTVIVNCIAGFYLNYYWIECR